VETDNIRALFVKCITTGIINATTDESYITVTYPDNTSHIIFRRREYITDTIAATDESVLTIPINKNQSTITFTNVNIGGLTAEYTLFGVQQVKTQALSPDVDFISIAGTVDKSAGSDSYIVSSDTTLSGTTVWSSEKPTIGTYNNWNYIVPIEIDSNVTKTVLEWVQRTNDINDSDDDDNLTGKIIIDWNESKIHGNLSTSDGSVFTAVGYLTSSTLNGLHTFEWNKSSNSNCSIELNGRNLTKLPFYTQTTGQTLNYVTYSITNYKTVNLPTISPTPYYTVKTHTYNNKTHPSDFLDDSKISSKYSKISMGEINNRNTSQGYNNSILFTMNIYVSKTPTTRTLYTYNVDDNFYVYFDGSLIDHVENDGSFTADSPHHTVITINEIGYHKIDMVFNDDQGGGNILNMVGDIIKGDVLFVEPENVPE
jgi:hypothetical protein